MRYVSVAEGTQLELDDVADLTTTDQQTYTGTYAESGDPASFQAAEITDERWTQASHSDWDGTTFTEHVIGDSTNPFLTVTILGDGKVTLTNHKTGESASVAA